MILYDFIDITYVNLNVNEDVHVNVNVNVMRNASLAQLSHPLVALSSTSTTFRPETICYSIKREIRAGKIISVLNTNKNHHGPLTIKGQTRFSAKTVSRNY